MTTKKVIPAAVTAAAAIAADTKHNEFKGASLAGALFLLQDFYNINRCNMI